MSRNSDVKKSFAHSVNQVLLAPRLYPELGNLYRQVFVWHRRHCAMEQKTLSSDLSHAVSQTAKQLRSMHLQDRVEHAIPPVQVLVALQQFLSGIEVDNAETTRLKMLNQQLMWELCLACLKAYSSLEVPRSLPADLRAWQHVFEKISEFAEDYRWHMIGIEPMSLPRPNRLVHRSDLAPTNTPHSPKRKAAEHCAPNQPAPKRQRVKLEATNDSEYSDLRSQTLLEKVQWYVLELFPNFVYHAPNPQSMMDHASNPTAQDGMASNSRHVPVVITEQNHWLQMFGAACRNDDQALLNFLLELLWVAVYCHHKLLVWSEVAANYQRLQAAQQDITKQPLKLPTTLKRLLLHQQYSGLLQQTYRVLFHQLQPQQIFAQVIRYQNTQGFQQLAKLCGTHQFSYFEVLTSPIVTVTAAANHHVAQQLASCNQSMIVDCLLLHAINNHKLLASILAAEDSRQHFVGYLLQQRPKLDEVIFRLVLQIFAPAINRMSDYQQPVVPTPALLSALTMTQQLMQGKSGEERLIYWQKFLNWAQGRQSWRSTWQLFEVAAVLSDHELFLAVAYRQGMSQQQVRQAIEASVFQNIVTGYQTIHPDHHELLTCARQVVQANFWSISVADFRQHMFAVANKRRSLKPKNACQSPDARLLLQHKILPPVMKFLINNWQQAIAHANLQLAKVSTNQAQPKESMTVCLTPHVAAPGSGRAKPQETSKSDKIFEPHVILAKDHSGGLPVSLLTQFVAVAEPLTIRKMLLVCKNWYFCLTYTTPSVSKQMAPALRAQDFSLPAAENSMLLAQLPTVTEHVAVKFELQSLSPNSH